MARKTVKLAIKTGPPEDPNAGVRTGNGVSFSWFDTEDIEYTLKMDHWQNDESCLEEIELTREEYIALKAQVVKMRGIKPEDEAKAA